MTPLAVGTMFFSSLQAKTIGDGAASAKSSFMEEALFLCVLPVWGVHTIPQVAGITFFHRTPPSLPARVTGVGVPSANVSIMVDNLRPCVLRGASTTSAVA